jgi:hypothetical protein
MLNWEYIEIYCACMLTKSNYSIIKVQVIICVCMGASFVRPTLTRFSAVYMDTKQLFPSSRYAAVMTFNCLRGESNQICNFSALNGARASPRTRLCASAHRT